MKSSKFIELKLRRIFLKGEICIFSANEIQSRIIVCIVRYDLTQDSLVPDVITLSCVGNLWFVPKKHTCKLFVLLIQALYRHSKKIAIFSSLIYQGKENQLTSNFEHRWRFNNSDFNNAIMHLFLYNPFDDQNWLIGWEMKWLTLPWQSSSWSYVSNSSGLLFIEKYRLPLLDNRMTAWMSVFKKQGQVLSFQWNIFHLTMKKRNSKKNILKNDASYFVKATMDRMRSIFF